MSELTGTEPRLFRAKHRGARIAPDKVRPMANLIRRRPVPEALDTLSMLGKRGGTLLRKVLATAVANAQDHDDNLDPDDFVVAEVRVDEGSPLKRVRFRAYGRASRFRRRTSHITVVIASTKQE